MLLTVKYSKFSYRPMDIAPANLLRGKAGMKMNEMNRIYVSLFTRVLKCSASELISSLDG